MITASGLRKRYGDTVAVDNLSFEVRPGLVTGFLGPNGAGKSTTMHLMLGLDYGDGEARFDGRRFRDIHDPMNEMRRPRGPCLSPDQDGTKPPSHAGGGQQNFR